MGLVLQSCFVLFGGNFKFLLSHKARRNGIWFKDNDGIACLVDIKCGCGIDGGKSALVSGKVGKGVICCCPFLHLLLDAGVGNGNVVIAQDILQGNLMIGLQIDVVIIMVGVSVAPVIDGGNDKGQIPVVLAGDVVIRC